MTKQVDIGGVTYEARYLSESDRDQLNALVADDARRLWNPLVPFAEHLQVLPEPLQAVALAEYIRRPEFGQMPRSAFLEAMAGIRCIGALSILVLGQDICTEDNAGEVLRALEPFIRQETIAVSGPSQLDQINQLRQLAGQPPLGG